MIRSGQIRRDYDKDGSFCYEILILAVSGGAVKCKFTGFGWGNHEKSGNIRYIDRSVVRNRYGTVVGQLGLFNHRIGAFYV